MDTLTHGLSGALVGRALSKRAKIVTPTACIVTGALAGTFPDFDIIFKILGNEAYLWNHRGITHSLFFLPFWAALISIFLAWIFTKSSKPNRWFQHSEIKYNKLDVFKDIYLISALGIFVHILGDLITSFGTMMLWPNMTRYEFGSVFIIDLFFTGIIILGLLLSWKFGDTTKKKANIAIFASLLLVSYVGFTQYMRELSKDFMVERIQVEYPELKNNKNIIFDSKPQMFLPTNWTGIAYDKSAEKYYYLPIDLLNTKNHWKEISVFNKWGSMNTDRSKVVFEHPKMEFARWFVQYPYVLSEDDKCVMFSDLRYKSPFRGKNPFSYGLCDDK